MRTGVKLGIDVGTVRIGVACSDPNGILAVPVTVVRRDNRGQRDLDDIATLAQERDACEVLVGLPRPLRGGENASSRAARDYAAALAERTAPIPVRLVDERFSTVEASRALRAAGRDARSSRQVVDAQ